MKRFATVAAIVLFCSSIAGPVWAAMGDSVVNSPHNLSASGPGPVRSATENEVCIFCHTSHRAGVTPLWNRSLSKAPYITYKSTTAKAAAGQPTGASKLCLSCHDGTIALGRVLTREQTISMSSDRPRGRKNLGTDLSDDHPISLTYSEAISGNPGRYHGIPMAIGSEEDLLDENGQVQCTSCHDAHNNMHGDFLVMDNRNGQLCTTCHNIEDWMQSSHNTSTARWNGAGPDPWPYTEFDDVQSNACANCHSVHDAGEAQPLLTDNTLAQTCYNCHNGSVARKDIRPDFDKPYRHRVEAVIAAKDERLGLNFDSSQVGCSDCHNPHAANDVQLAKPLVSGSLKGVSGISSNGGIRRKAEFEYEVCYKCHSRVSSTNITKPIRRLAYQSSLREKFGVGAVSFHPVEGVGRGTDVPSLRPPLTVSSLVSCTDCHNNDSAGGGAGGEVAGPHGSQYRFLLERRYETGDMISESEPTYALCYKCHDRLNILSDLSFNQHRSHIVDERTPCSVCHDPHGISRTEGSIMHNAHLVNFDITVVRPDTVTGRLEYTTEGSRAGMCFLNCHGVDHSPKSY